MTGAVHLLEEEWEKPLILDPCGHHVAERYFDSCVKAKFGDKTESPDQKQCLDFKKWFEANKESLPSTIKFDPANPTFSLDDPFLANCRKDLMALKERISKGDRLSLPRGDYEDLWEYVQVMIENGKKNNST